MAVSENQLETWSHQGSVAQSAATYQTIRKVLESNSAPYFQRRFDIFLQGSYSNDTNIYSDSDVDIVISLTSTYYSDLSSLSEEDRARYDTNFSASTYSYETFRQEVFDWLKANFGEGVSSENKAIYIPASGSRREADVLVAVDHHDYQYYRGPLDNHFYRGIAFWSRAGVKIVNYPRQHSTNATTKHQKTYSRFKPAVRIVKNMRNAMIEKGLLDPGLAPSYFLEGMLYNVPDADFSMNLQDRIANSLNYVKNCDRSKLVCANERYMLLHPSSPVTWRAESLDKYLTETIKYWNGQ